MLVVMSRSRHIRWMVPVLASITLVVLSFLPFPVKHLLHTQNRLHNGGHVLVFCGVTLAMLWDATTWRAASLIVLGMALLAVGIEEGQHLVYPGEIFEWQDLLFDGLGICLGGLANYLAGKRGLPARLFLAR